MEAARFRPTDAQLCRRDALVHLLGNAMGCGPDLVPPASVLHRVARVAVDVTCGDATDDDLRSAAERYLGELDAMVEAEPIRRALRGVIEEIADEAPGDRRPSVDIACIDNDLSAERADPGKGRSA